MTPSPQRVAFLVFDGVTMLDVSGLHRAGADRHRHGRPGQAAAQPRDRRRRPAQAAVTPRHLTRLFRPELDTTPARRLERVRLDRAHQLLLDGHSVTSAPRPSTAPDSARPAPRERPDGGGRLTGALDQGLTSGSGRP